MPYQSISPQRYRYLRRDFLENRSEECSPLASYREAVNDWARKSPQRMHDHCQDLMKAVSNPTMLAKAINQIGRMVVFDDAEKAACHKWQDWDWLRELETRLLDRKFRKGKYEKFKIPKPGKSGTRTIEVPPIETRIVARNLSNILVPLLDPDFYPLSIGFRPRRCPHHGLAAAEKLLAQGLTHWVTCDIRDAFGRLPKKRCLQIVNSRLHNSPVMWLVEEILDRKRKRGVPQGISISPLMLNVYLDHHLDHWWQEHFPETVMVRYADDILVACPTKESAVASFAALQDRMTKIALPIKESQYEAVHDLGGGDSVDLLGFQIRFVDGQMILSLSHKSWDKLENSLSVTKHKLDKLGEPVDLQEIAIRGFGWLVEKTAAVDEDHVAGVADQIRQLSNQCGLDMTQFTDEEAQNAWDVGQRQWKLAREAVINWLPTSASAA